MKRRSYIKKVSDKQKDLNDALKIAVDEAKKEQNHLCYLCQRKSKLEGAHIIGRYTCSMDIYVSVRNIAALCRTCHTTFDDGPLLQFLELPNSELLLQRMKELDELYYNRYLDLTINMQAQVIFINQYRKIAPGTIFNAEIQQFSDKTGFQVYSVQGNDSNHFHIGRVDVAEIFNIIQFVDQGQAELFQSRYSKDLPPDLKICYSVASDDVSPDEGLDSEDLVEEDIP